MIKFSQISIMWQFHGDRAEGALKSCGERKNNKIKTSVKKAFRNYRSGRPKILGAWLR